MTKSRRAIQSPRQSQIKSSSITLSNPLMSLYIQVFPTVSHEGFFFPVWTYFFSYKWDHRVCSLWIWIYVANVFTIHIVGYISNLLFLIGEQCFIIKQLHQFIYSFILNWKTFICFQFLVLINKTIINIHMDVFIWT